MATEGGNRDSIMSHQSSTARSKPFRSIAGMRVRVDSDAITMPNPILTTTPFSHPGANDIQQNDTNLINIELAMKEYNQNAEETTNDTINHNKSMTVSFQITENEMNELMETADEIIEESSRSHHEEIQQHKTTQNPSNKTPVPTSVKNIDESDSDLSDFAQTKNISTKNLNKSGINSSQTLDPNISLKLQNKIQTNLMCSGHFWLRICILLLTIMLILLCLSYAFGAISSTQLVIIERCPGMSLEEIWQNSLAINSTTGEKDGCFVSTDLEFDEHSAYDGNTYRYKAKYDGFAIFQCVLFSLFTVYCVGILIYGIYNLIKDLIAIKQKKLYQYAPKFKDYIRDQRNLKNKHHGIIHHKQLQHPINACFERWKHRYDKIFGTDTNGYIVRTMIMETWEIMLQTFALLLYNGYNVWSPNEITLAYKSSLIYLFVTVLSFNCLITGVLWLLYVFKQGKCSGLLFHLSLFCVDQFSDFFYAIFPFIVIFGSPNVYLDNVGSDGVVRSRIWVFFGLLNIDTTSQFLYAVFPIFLLCNKCLMMTRKAIRGMRNESFDEWMFVTKLMNQPDPETAIYLSKMYGFKIETKPNMEDLPTVESTPSASVGEGCNGKTQTKTNTAQTTNILGDEIYDHHGNLNIKISKSGYGLYGKPKSKRCRFCIGIIAMTFIIYSIIILSIVIDHLSTSIEFCASGKDDINIIAYHPELFVYSEYCAYQVHPFRSGHISNSCDCREFVVDFDFEFSDEYANRNITEISIIDGVLTNWRMLEKFRVRKVASDPIFGVNAMEDGGMPGSKGSGSAFTDTESTEIFEFNPSHFGAVHMKLFSFADIDVKNGSLDEAFGKYKELRYLEFHRIGTPGKIPASIAELSQLKVIRFLFNTGLNGYMDILCNLTELQVFNIRGGLDQYIPKCITKLTKLSTLFIHVTELRAFPLEILNMTNLQEIDLWYNDIKYNQLLEYNDLDHLSEANQTQFWDNFDISDKDHLLTFILNNNQLCDPSKTFEPFINWANRTGPACDREECSKSAQGRSAHLDRDPLDADGCSPLLLGNGICNFECQKDACHFDDGDCNQHCFTLTNCTYDMFMNQICDQECNNEYCRWDAEYCIDNATDTSQPYPTMPRGKGSELSTNTTSMPDGKGSVGRISSTKAAGGIGSAEPASSTSLPDGKGSMPGGKGPP